MTSSQDLSGEVSPPRQWPYKSMTAKDIAFEIVNSWDFRSLMDGPQGSGFFSLLYADAYREFRRQVDEAVRLRNEELQLANISGEVPA